MRAPSRCTHRAVVHRQLRGTNARHPAASRWQWCPQNCSGVGTCNGTRQACDCPAGRTGSACEFTDTQAYWEIVAQLDPYAPAAVLQTQARTRHSAVVYGGYLWMYGGYVSVFGITSDILRFDPSSGTFAVVPVASQPDPRYGHAAAVYGDCMYVFGGTLASGLVTNEVRSGDCAMPVRSA